ncbi:MAG: SDR family NAD(P)-dependent oxidoreductase [Xanthomonadaceae bacterium]|nr:SDR family NAD(P)-dependent oxidoreductase [Xanthomonadaceae bacterium]
MKFHALNKRFQGKRAFITGAGSGLGLAIARALASDGWALGLFDRNLERLAVVEADLSTSGFSVLAYPGDVTQADELTVAVNSFASSNDGLDIMINNAGVATAGTLMEVPAEDWQAAIDTNVMGVIHGCRAAIPHLQRNGTGLLINISSAAAFGSAPGMIPYNATKAAVLSVSESLMGELREIGTQVSVVMPTFFQSNLLDSFRGPAETRNKASELIRTSRYTAEAIARDLLIAAGKGKTHIVLPRSARWLWTIKRLMPSFFLNTLLPTAARLR